MRFLRRAWAVLVVAIKRLLSQRWLAVATMLGLVMSIALALSIPLYADAVYYRVLREELWGQPDVGQATDLPLTLMFRYIGGWDASLQWETVAPADDYMTQQGVGTLRLPPTRVVRHFRTDTFGLFPTEDAAYAGNQDPLVWGSFAFASDFADHITVEEGAFPAVAPPAPDAPVEVLVSAPLAEELGLQVGEAYVAFGRYQTPEIVRNVEIPMQVAGVWTPTDPEAPYWFAEPAKLEEMLFVPEATFTGRIADTLENEVYVALWYLVLDGSELHADDVGYLVGRILTVQQRVSGLLPNTRLDVSPMDALRRYWQASGLLTILLYAFSVPILSLILAFIVLVVSLAVGRQRNEIAVLRSRGATVAQVVGIAALEALVLGALSLVVGVPVAEGIAHLIGRARSFLDFSIAARLRVEATNTTLYFGLAAVGLALLAQVVPTLGAARHTIVTYKQERARALRPPWWQRVWLDGLLLIPAAYGAYLLRQQGSIALPGVEASGVGDPFQNPLLFLVPALGVFAITLFILRLLPLLMGALAWVASRVGTVGFLMASRHLSRTPGFYFAPLMLLVLTLSLSTFVASLAQTLDHHLYDQRYYQVGADMRVVEQGEATGAERMRFVTGERAGTDEGPRWLFLPVSEHLKVPGVQAATRVGRFQAFYSMGGSMRPATFMGVDRAAFTQVAFWREDFAEQSLGGLMNGLALRRNGVLVPRSFARAHAFNVGDVLPVTVDTYGQRNKLNLEIVGIFELFPTWYPTDEQQGVLFVGNLDYLFEQAGGQFPYDVWLDTAPAVEYEAVAEGVRDLQLRVQYWNAPLPQIFAEQRRPERQGMFGVLSVGFVAAALLTALGFLLYAFFSFRRRFIELGVLRAIGLSARQMTSFLAWELAFLVLVGLGAGTGLGAWISNLFIPYLQVGVGPSAQIPPYVVEISWPAIFRIYALFGLLFVAALGVLIALLFRMKIFQAIKMGETA